MIPYLGCSHARELLEGFLDGELSVADQVAVESHLRWCRTCAARIDDLRLIGAAVRSRVPAPRSPHDDAQALASMQARVLTRIRAERDQALCTRIRDLCADMRLFWPALGATIALLVCAGLTQWLHVTTSEQLAQMLAAKMPLPAARIVQMPYAVVMLEPGARPGSDQNPIRLDDAQRVPQLLDENLLAGIPDDEAVFALATVVSQKGRIENYELLSHESFEHRPPAHLGHVDTVLTAVRQSRFAPARGHGGDAVAVNMVWLIAKTTAVADRPRPAVSRRPARAQTAPVPEPAAGDAVPADDGRSALPRDSSTA